MLVSWPILNPIKMDHHAILFGLFIRNKSASPPTLEGGGGGLCVDQMQEVATILEAACHRVEGLSVPGITSNFSLDTSASQKRPVLKYNLKLPDQYM